MKENHRSLLARIDAYTPDDPGAAFPYSARLARENGWSRGFTRRVIEEYKRFAYLAAVAGHPVTPSDQVDQAWHLHMIYTRSYWDDFCGEVLGMPLHHGPTKGGGKEHDKYTDWYGRTLDSYREIFGAEPPGDIWPSARRRFGEDVEFQRVNRARHWVIRKPRWWRKLKAELSLQRRQTRALQRLVLTSAAMVLLVGGLTGCTTLVVGVFSPVDELATTPFAVHAVSGALGLLAALWLRRHLRALPGPGVAADPALLADPYAVAYLAGREDRATDTVLVRLLEYGAIEAKSERGKVVRCGDLPAGAQPLEVAAFGLIGANSGTRVSEIRRDMGHHYAPLRRRIEAEGLAVEGKRARAIAALSLTVALLAPAIGWACLYGGLGGGVPDRDRFGLNLILTVVALAVFGRTHHRSRAGDRLLGRLRQGGRRGGEASAAGELAHAVALFGIVALEGTAHADFIPAVAPRDASGGGCGSGCGAAGDDSGCGGCGGCGCGG